MKLVRVVMFVLSLALPVAGIALETAVPLAAVEDAKAGGSIKPGTAISYSLLLSSGQYLRISATSPSADLALRVTGPDGLEMQRSNRWSANEGVEELLFIAHKDGEHRVEVSCIAAALNAPDPSFDLRVEASRPAGESERAIAEAYATYNAMVGMPWHKTGPDQAEGFLRLERAATASQQAGDRALEAAILLALGRARREAAQGGDAELTRALEAARKSSQPVLEIKALVELGGSALNADALQRAEDNLREALALARPETPPTVLADAHTRMGNLRVALGQPTEAAQEFESALTLWKTWDHRLEASTLSSYGILMKSLGKRDKALELQKRALEKIRRTGASWEVASVLANIGYLQLAIGALDDASASLKEARSIHRTDGNASGESMALQGLGDIRMKQSRDADALVLFQSASATDPASPSDYYLHYRLAQLYARTGRSADAIKEIEATITTVDAIARDLRGEQQRASFRSWRRPFYELHVATTMSLAASTADAAWVARGFEVSDNGRAHILRDRLATAGVDVEPGATPATGKAEVAVPRPTERTQNAASHEITLHDLQKQLPRGTALVEYFLGKDEGFVWLVTADSITYAKLPGRATIEEAASPLRTASRAPGQSRGLARIEEVQQPEIAELERRARVLSDLVLAPVAARLSSARQVVFVLDGPLQYVSFATLSLPVAGRYEPLSKLAISYAPSASVGSMLERTAKGRNRSTVAIFADPVVSPDDERLRAGSKELGSGSARAGTPPDGEATAVLKRLPFTSAEADQISAIAGKRQVWRAVGFEAAKQNVKSDRLEKFGVIHFAAHATIDNERPEKTAIHLTRFTSDGAPVDGAVGVADIARLRLRADVVVLSACDTALGKEARGEGLLGLTRAFIAAGVPTVVATLWPVDDESTAALMKEFYRAVLREKAEPAVALRRAQEHIRTSPRWAHPYYWAGFTVHGHWARSGL